MGDGLTRPSEDQDNYVSVYPVPGVYLGLLWRLEPGYTPDLFEPRISDPKAKH